MHPNRLILARTLAVVALGALAACSSSPREGGGPASAVIAPAGGTLEAFDASGARYTLTFPAGAVDEPTTITLTPLGSAPAALAGFRLAPAGLVLNAAATLEVDLAAGMPVPATATFALGAPDDPTFVATTVQGARLSAALRYFAVPDSGWSVHTAPGAQAAGSEDRWGPASAAAVDPLPHAPPHLAPQQEEGDAVRAVEADCGRRLDAMRASFDGLLASDSFQEALRVVQNAGALAMTCGADEQVLAWQAEIDDVACARYEELVLNAEVIAADEYDVFTELIQPIMSWWGTLETLGLACSGSKAPTQVIGEKYGQFLTFYAGEVTGLRFTADYDQLLGEARKVSSLRGKASLLALPAAETMLEQQVLFPTMDLLRDRSFDECVAEADHYYLYSLLEQPFLSQRVPIGTLTAGNQAASAQPSPIADFRDADVQTDIQYCASNLTLEVWADPEVPEELTDKRRQLGPGGSPGEQTREAATDGPVEGHLVLRGPVEQLLCGEERTLEPHQLVVRLDGTEVHRAANLDGNPEIDVEAALVAAGRDPAGLNDVHVSLVRESDACKGQYGSTEYELFTVTYTADPAPRVTSVSAAPASLTAEQEASFTFQIPWIDAGKNLQTLHVDYDLAGSVRSERIDLATSAAVAGFQGGNGTGTYTQTLWVGCSEKGDSPIVVTAVLEDEYGQRSDERQTSVAVTYGACPAAAVARGTD